MTGPLHSGQESRDELAAQLRVCSTFFRDRVRRATRTHRRERGHPPPAAGRAQPRAWERVDEHVDIAVTVTRSGDDWWNVSVENGNGGEFAMSSATTLHHALRGAVAYIECAVEEAAGPFAEALRAAALAREGER